jgi:hypothetical protein
VTMRVGKGREPLVSIKFVLERTDQYEERKGTDRKVRDSKLAAHSTRRYRHNTNL